jgi:hypothetical protein
LPPAAEEPPEEPGVEGQTDRLGAELPEGRAGDTNPRHEEQPEPEVRRRAELGGHDVAARAIRRGSLFYVHNFAPDRWPCGDPELGLADTDAGPTKAAIEAAGTTDRFWQLCFGKRPADELYDLDTDPDCVVNLAADPARADDVRRLRQELFAELTRQEDPRVLGRGAVFDEYPSPHRAK